MPTAIAIAATFVADIIGVAALDFLIKFTGVQLLSSLTSKLFGPKPDPNQGLIGLQVLNRSALEYRKIAYGQTIVSGPITYNNLSGPNGEFLWYDVALLDGLSDSVISIWLDGEEIPVADIDWVPGIGSSDGTGSGAVSTTRWVGDGSTTAVRIFYYLGDDNQPVSTTLNSTFGDISASHQQRGITHLLINLLYNQQTENVFKSGAPQNIRVVLRGRRIYDPRLDSTNGGSGLHRYTDSATWQWSDNPSLCVADYLFNVMNVDPASSIDWPSIAASANDCDVLVAIPTASTETRFSCNGALSFGTTHKDNLDSILSSMAGKLSYTGGVWRVRASVWEASSVSIDANDLAGPVEVRGSSPKSERFNGVRGFFVDPARKYEAAEFPHVSSSAYIARDNNEPILYDLQLPMTNSSTMAQRISFRNVEQGDNQVVANLTMNVRGSQVSIGDIVDLTLDDLSWSLKTFRCIEWNRNPDGTFKVVLKEDESGDYADPLESEYSAGGSSAVTVPADVIPPATSLIATGVFGGVQLDWADPPSRLFDHFEVWSSYDNDRANATVIATPKSSPFIDNVSSTIRERFYWVRAVNFLDNISVYEPITTTTTARAYPFVQQQALLADPFIRQGASNWENLSGLVYQTSAGTNGTDTLRISTTSVATGFLSSARRGPQEYDVTSSGRFSVEVRWRIMLQDAGVPGWAGFGAFASIRIENENETNGVTYQSIGSKEFSAGDATGVWFDDSAVVEIVDTGTPPRFIRVGLLFSVNLLGPTFDIDFIDASIIGKSFSGPERPGLVPDPGTAAGQFLRDDGTWNTPAGGITDHGGLSGLGDNDHPQYALSASTQTITGTWSYSAAVTVNGTHIRINSAAPAVWYDETDVSVDNGSWLMGAASESFVLRAYNDNFTSSNIVFSAQRTGTTVDSFNINTALTAISYGGITQSDLVDKSANEEITGHWSVPSTINTQNGAYTLVISDSGRTIRKATSTASITHTIPANSSVAFPIGTLIAWQNDGNVNMTIAITTDTLTGTDGITGSRTLGPNDTAVAQKVASTSWKYAASDL
jgi:hypothetical protein